MQLTFSAGNCSSSIYLLANLKFLFTNYMHTCMLIILFFMTFGHSKLDNRNVIINYGSPIAPNRPCLLHRPPRVSHQPQGCSTAHFGNHWCRLTKYQQSRNRHNNNGLNNMVFRIFGLKYTQLFSCCSNVSLELKYYILMSALSFGYATH